MRVRVAILLAVVFTAVVISRSSAGSVRRTEDSDSNATDRPSLRQCKWYRNLCRFLNPCWFRQDCQGHPNAICRVDLCECKAEYYDAGEKIDCQEVTDEPEEPDSVPVDTDGQDCQPVDCRMFCLDGYVKDSNGCDTCECIEPEDRPGVCPTPRLDQVSTCGIECSSDAGCAEGEKCCSNGCGRVCVPACSGNICRLNCLPFGGFARDENGCEICRCRNRGFLQVCPVVDSDSVGICVTSCETDNDCSNEGEKCCSNGCGHNCVRGCEPVRCRMFCEHGYETDENNCEICKCKSPPGCTLVTCRMGCRFGFQRDENGCEICRCFDPRPRGVGLFSRPGIPEVASTCPSTDGGGGGICVNTCSSDDSCSDGQKCCSNGCGRVCTTPCPRVRCRMACRFGYVKDDRGCDICQCKPPRIKFGRCPAVPDGVAGTCANECETDDDCNGLTMKCCSNGCGRTCTTACSPVRCRLGCRWGFATNSDGCEICRCLPRPDSTPGECPALVDEGTGGICVTECGSDSECFEDKKCCSNGCGRVCVPACPSFKCRINCPFGYVTDKNGCQGCECKPPTQVCPLFKCRINCPFGYVRDENGCRGCECKPPTPGFPGIPRICPVPPANVSGVCLEECDDANTCPTGQMCCSNGCGHTCVEGCLPVMCRMVCRHGWVRNEAGCEICQCKAPPPARPDYCMPLGCNRYCRNGFKKDADGCDICECKEEECRPVLCRMHCRYGWATDKNGCEICRCKEPPTDGPGLPLVCPVVPEGEVGICSNRSNTCEDGNTCPSDQLCCSNGCVRSCIEGCRPVVCRMYCPFGWATDENGCEVCRCKERPSDCRPLLCRLGCRNGYQTDENGCEICACRRRLPFLPHPDIPRPDISRIPRVCPAVAEDTVGTCAEECDGENTCPEGQICCSNGCGHTCIEGCFPVLCRMFCPFGWDTDENGCEICSCKWPTTDLFCPVLPALPPAGGTCVEECGADNPCTEEGQTCCSNGCGHSCVEGCPPVMCAMYCRHGWIRDARGCEICSCAPPPVELKCPTIPDGVAGLCAEDCTSDKECETGQRCCSNGCGHSCIKACRPVLCYMYCRHGWAKDESGCDICRCADPPEPQTDLLCPEVSSDVQGICVEECGRGNPCSEETQICCSNGCGHTCIEGCQPVLCEMYCEHGWARDDRGCEICSCKEEPTCAPANCGLTGCQYGRARDENGCETCRCNPAPGDLVCPEPKEGTFGICIDACVPDTPCGPGQKCCSNGCGHQCMTACAPPDCGATLCEHGRTKDANGCETCDCNTSPDEVECPDGEVYQECGSACPATCESVRIDEPMACIALCVPGCFCPSGTVRDSNNRCIKPEYCGCLYDTDGDGDKEYLRLGEGFDARNQRCSCRRGGKVICIPYTVVPCEECTTRKCTLNCGPFPGQGGTYTTVERCRNGKVYSECGSACPATCESLRIDEPMACPAVCRQGCFCPPGTVQDSDGTCVGEHHCGCLYDADGDGENEYYQLGDTFDAGDEQCRCRRGGRVVCKTACPVFRCVPTDCQYGYARDENGCQTCDCNPAPEEPVCEPVRCRRRCQYGFKVENGCPVCKCNDPPTNVVNHCEPVKCRMYCRYGFAEDANGCEICECNPPPDVVCSNGKIYRECGSACPTTCESLRIDEPQICPAICIQGCFCPPGTVLDSDGMCVRQQQCGCLYDADDNGEKEYYQLGESFELGLHETERCQCRRHGQVLCSRRRDRHPDSD